MSNPDYENVESLRDGDVLLVITRRKTNGHLTFRFVKEFEIRGDKKITAYLNRRHLGSVRRLLDKAEKVLKNDIRGNFSQSPEPGCSS